MFIAMTFIQAKLSPLTSEERVTLDNGAFEVVKDSDLSILIAPYLIIALVIVAMFIIIYFTKMPDNADTSHKIDLMPTLRRLWSNLHYREGVIAQFFYVGAQIMCWTFIIQYGTHYFMQDGMDERSAEVLSQRYNIVAMVIFCISRFICTFLLKYLLPGKLLMNLSIVASVFVLGVIARKSVGRERVYVLV